MPKRLIHSAQGPTSPPAPVVMSLKRAQGFNSFVSNNSIFKHLAWARKTAVHFTEAMKVSLETSEQYRLERNARRRWIDEQSSELNRDIRRIQAIIAMLIILIGLFFGGLSGLLVGAGIGLLIMSLRLKL